MGSELVRTQGARLMQWSYAGIAVLALLAASACGSSEEAAKPHCAGNPLPCEVLDHGRCITTPGCVPSGTCSGYSSQAVCSLDSSSTLCTLDGCTWTDECTGVPIGKCDGTSPDACHAVLGCSWGSEAASSSGVGGAIGAGGSGSGGQYGAGGYIPPPPPPPQPDFQCGNNASPCTTDADCTCGLKCMKKCDTCSRICGHACQTGADCGGPNDQTLFAFCDKQPSDQTGICH